MNRRSALLVALGAACGAAALGGCASGSRSQGVVAVEGLRNFGRVDAGVYRSAQPTARGFTEARGLGVRTVLNLRCEPDDAAALAETGLASACVPMRQWYVDEEKVASALRAMADPDLRPVLVHCQAGQDRTGVVVAAYRVAVEGWSRETAVAEMRAYGNHPLWFNLRRWVLRFDVERMRQRMGEAALPEVVRR